MFAVHEISTVIKYNKNLVSKILPYYYKLVTLLIKKKDIFIKILKDIEEGKFVIDPHNYKHLDNNIIKNINYKKIVNKDFNIFNKGEVFRYGIKCIYEIYKETKINKDYCLSKYLEMYDVYNEANFPPFSLIEVYDY